jgi:hypothetical protein
MQKRQKDENISESTNFLIQRLKALIKGIVE